MTVVLLLGLVDGSAVTPDGAPAHRRVASAGGLDALVTDRHPPRTDTDPEAEAVALALGQAAILSAYACGHDVLPVALGAAFSDDAALVRHLDAIASEIAEQRTAFAGMAEYVIAIETTASPSAAPQAAAAPYLRRRQAERDARRAMDSSRHDFAARVLAALRQSGATLAAPRAPARRSLLTVSALLSRRSVGDAAAALDALSPIAAPLGLGVRMVGPCAPFSFVAPGPARG
jgi:hypothetical protein